ncbi:hypothetical protein C0431_12240 [bacterium]|nr:hypothetical protein [bacterium]
MIQVKNQKEIMETMIERLAQLNLATDPGSIARGLSEGLAKPAEDLYEMMNIVLRDAKMSTAIDDELGKFGAMLRMPRATVVTKDEDGTPIERLQNDDEYRVALLGAFDALATSNEIAVRLEALLVPGIKDVKYERYTLGAGSFTAVPVTLPGFSYEEVVPALEVAYEKQAAQGVRFKIRTPRRKYLNMRLLILGDAQANAGSQAKKAVRQYIEELDPGESFIWIEALTRMKMAASTIVDIELNWMDVDNNPRPIGNVEVDEMEELMPGEIEIIMSGG